MKRTFFFCIVLMVMAMQVNAQGVGINADGSNPDNSAILDIKSPATGQMGVLFPRVNLVTGITSPAINLFGVNTNSAFNAGSRFNSGLGLYRYDGTRWNRLLESTDSTMFWGTQGNSGTNASTNFIGTADNTDLSIRANGIEKILVPRLPNGTMIFRNFTLADFSLLRAIRVPMGSTGQMGIQFHSSSNQGGMFGYTGPGGLGVGIKTNESNGLIASFSNFGMRIQAGTNATPVEPENSRLDVDGNILTRGKIVYNEYTNALQKTFLNEIHWNGIIGSASDSPQLLTEASEFTVVIRRTAGNNYFLRIATRLPRVFTCIDQDSKQIITVNTPGPNLTATNRVPINFTNDIAGADGLRTIFIKEPARPEVTFQVTLLVLSHDVTVMIKRFEN